MHAGSEVGHLRFFVHLRAHTVAHETTHHIETGGLHIVLHGGTTDYACDIYYSAVKGEKFTCPIAKGTYMDMMYMPDALRAAVELMEADPARLIHRNGFNIAAMSFDPEGILAAIRKYKPQFEMDYKVEPLKQANADSWPNSLDDTCARQEWDWKPEYDLDAMTRDMLEKLASR